MGVDAAATGSDVPLSSTAVDDAGTGAASLFAGGVLVFASLVPGCFEDKIGFEPLQHNTVASGAHPRCQTPIQRVGKKLSSARI